MLNIETANVVYTLKMLRVVKLVAFFIVLKLIILDIINIIAPPQKEYVMYNLLLVIISYTGQRVDYITISSTGELFFIISEDDEEASASETSERNTSHQAYSSTSNNSYNHNSIIAIR